MTGILFGAIVLSIILISAAGWLLAGNVTAIVNGRLGRQRSRAVFVAAGIAVIVAASVATWWFAARSREVATMPPEAATALAPVANAAGAAAGTPGQAGDLTVLVGRLEARLAREPDDAEGWALFARTQMELRRYPAAAAAYAKATALLPADADLQTERADAEFMANNRQWTNAAGIALAAALKLQPDHLEALWLSGSERFDNKDFAAACRHWERLARLAPADSEYAKQLKTSLAEARALRDGKDPVAAVAAAGATAMTPATPPTPAQDARAQLAADLRAALGAPEREPSPAGEAAGPVAVRGEIRVDPAVRSRISAQDTVFVFARDANAGQAGMPLAAARYRAADLPVRFELSDNTAMPSATKLSTARSLVVTARISKSGAAGARPGDLESSAIVIAPGAANVAITIDKVL